MERKNSRYLNKICKILLMNHSFIIVEFDGYGITLEINDSSKLIDKDTVKIKYIGKIGTPNFKCELVT